MVITVTWSRIVLRPIQVRRINLEPATVGEPYIVRYEVTNRAKHIAGFSLWIEEKQSPNSTWKQYFRKARGWIMEVGAGETVHGEAIFWPLQRGEAVFDRIHITTSFPFGVIRSSKSVHQQVRVLIQPQVFPLRPSVISAIISSGPLGQRSLRRGRGGDDYYGLRELTSGDRLGDIAWKASARREELVCIQRSKPALPRIRVVLDLTTPTKSLQCDGDPRALEEQAISLCASLLVEALRQDQEIAMTILGLQTPQSTRFHGGTRHLSRLLSSLAQIDLDLDRDTFVPQQNADMQHDGLILVRPDRASVNRKFPEAWCFTASQLPSLQLQTPLSDTA